MSEHVRCPTDHARQRMPVAMFASRRHVGIRSPFGAALAIAGLGTWGIVAPRTDADQPSTDRTEAIDAIVTEQMRELHLPGLALWDRGVT